MIKLTLTARAYGMDLTINSDDDVSKFKDVIPEVYHTSNDLPDQHKPISPYKYESISFRSRSDNSLIFESRVSADNPLEVNSKVYTSVNALGLDLDGLYALVGADPADQPADTPVTLRDKLQTLTGNERLDSSAIKNLPGLNDLIKQYGKDGRVRFDESIKHFFFEVKQPNGSWLKKAEIGGSLIIDTVKFEESSEKPTVKANELGLYSKMVQVPAHDNLPSHQALRPFFVLHSGEEVPLVGVWGGKLRIPQPDGSDEYAAFESDITPAKIVGYITQELGNEDWKSGGSGSVPQSVLNDVAANKAELARLKTNIGQDAESVYTYRGSTAPTDLNDEKHRAYYLSLFNVGKGLVIDMPNPVDDLETGAIFCIDNNDKNNFFMLEPPIGETINGKSDQLKVRPSSVAFLVKAGTDWNVAFSGYLPPNLDTLVKAVQAKLPSGGTGPTIDEIQAQLKDRLHTFREIQNEFNDQLHTMPDLEVAGFLKAIFEYGFVDSNAEPFDTTWIDGQSRFGKDLDIAAANTGNKHLAITIPVVVYPVLKTLNVDGSDMDFTTYDYVVNGITKRLIITDSTVDTNSKITVKFELGVDGAGSSNLGIYDGTIDAAGVKKINVKGSKITDVAADPSEITLTSGMDVHMEAPNQQYGNDVTTELVVMPPLNVWNDDSDPNKINTVRMEIKPGTFASVGSPGFLGYLKEEEEIVGKLDTPEVHHKGSLWFDDIVVPASSYLFLDRANKVYGIQDYGNDDPNISGGADFLVAFRASMRGKAPSDGVVRIALIHKGFTPFDDNQGYIKDANGNDMVVEKHYRLGDELGILDLLSVVNAKGLTEFRCVVADSFSGGHVVLEDRTQGATGLMIQSVGHSKTTPEEKGKTGDALQQFELDTNQNIEFTSHYMGEDRMTLQWIVKNNVPVTVGPARDGQLMNDGISFYNLSPAKIGVVDGYVVIEDNGTDVCDFYFGKIFSAEETQLLRGKTINVQTTLENKNDAFVVSLMKWIGTPDMFPQAIYNSRNNGALVMNQSWVEEDNQFISEEPTVDDHVAVTSFTVPMDANNYAIVIYPTNPQQPLSLKLKELKVDVDPTFTGYVIHAPELRGEEHLVHSDSYKEFVQDNQGFGGLRYTINNDVAGLPMPCGIPKKGRAGIIVDPSVNQISGSSAQGGEGALKFSDDGTAKINTDLLIWNEQKAPTTVTFWWALVSPDGGTYSKVAGSETVFTVPIGSVPSKFSMNEFKTSVKAGDRLALRASASVADGAYLESVSPKNPMVTVKINFDQIITDASDTPVYLTQDDLEPIKDDVKRIDDEIEITPEAKAAGWYIQLSVSQDGVPSLSPKQRKS